MKTLSTALIFLTLAWSATSQAFFLIPMRDMGAIEKNILTQIKLKLVEDGVSQHGVANYSLDWTQKSFRCVEADAPFLPEIQVGTCVITAKADGITALAAIVKNDTGYVTTILTIEVE